MPQVAVAVVAAAAAKAAGAIITNVILSAVVSAVVGAAISYAGASLFATKPEASAAALGVGAALSSRTQMVRQSVATRPIVYGETAVSGPITFLNVTDGKRKLQLLITLTGHPVEEIGDIWFGDTKVFEGSGTGGATGKFAGYATFWKGDGTEAGDADLLAAMRARNSEWTVDHKQEGCAKLYCELTWDQDVYASGIPQIKALVKGKNDIYDPRTETTGYTNNWALVTADYVASSAGVGAGYASINEDDLIASANVSDEVVDLAAGGTEKRYVVSGVVDTGKPVGDNLRELLNPGAGIACRAGGEWAIHAGYYRTPEYTVDESWLDGPIRLRTRQSKRELFNTVRAVYASEDSLWQPTDLPVLKSEVFIAEDQGETIATDYQFLYTTSPSCGQRLQKQALFRNRQQIEVELQCNLKAMAVRVGDVVGFTRSAYGWDDKPFEIVAWRFAPRDDGDVIRLGIDMTLRETSAEGYDWTTADEKIVAVSAASTLPSPSDVEPPDGLDVTEVKYSTRDGGGIKVKVVLQSGEADDGFVTDYQFESRLLGELEWTVYPRVKGRPFLELFDVATGIYDWRVKAVSVVGPGSDYVTVRKEIQGLGDTPATPTGVTISVSGGFVFLRWNRSPDLDVTQGGVVRFRHCQALSGATLATSTSIGDDVPGGDTMAVLPLKPGSYLVQFVDAVGTVSDPAVVTTDGATVLEYSTYDTVVESAAYDGTHDGTIVNDDGDLTLQGAGLVDDIIDFDAVSSIDAYGGIRTSGEYDWGSGLDFGTKRRMRLTASVTVEVVNVVDLIDDRPGLVDDWPDWDGEASGEGDCTIWVRTTDDDPNVSPTWSEWQRLDSAEVYCRGTDFKAVLTVSDQSYNIRVSDMRVTAEQLV
ncbi:MULTISPECIES: phage tail protein [unclassified Thalassospira]|uniref:phage tail protein n=1 Tax=unclassified Thalassospira TaxID=2648997 RepID=UPI0007A628EF|nr:MULTISPECIES: phage tail protein [unclassified Thalassospira]KZC99683.1 hypothetical protein AUQ41_08370 [Thalassospira sp. MCCC 1A02898]ONH85393.1 hypothetical protein TH47_05980 [Thalassospira sp. MCCC 1A02803]